MLLTETQDPVAAQAAIERLGALAEEWASKLRAAEKSLKAVEVSAGETVLASILQGNDGTEAAVTSLANARAAYDIALKTLASIEHHQVIAQANLKLARAHTLRQEAAQKAQERGEHMAKVNDLLDKLKDLEGALYVPFKPQVRPGTYSDPVAYAVPLSETMERAIRDLLFQAEQLEVSARATLAKAKARLS